MDDPPPFLGVTHTLSFLKLLHRSSLLMRLLNNNSGRYFTKVLYADLLIILLLWKSKGKKSEKRKGKLLYQLTSRAN